MPIITILFWLPLHKCQKEVVGVHSTVWINVWTRSKSFALFGFIYYFYYRNGCADVYVVYMRSSLVVRCTLGYGHRYTYTHIRVPCSVALCPRAVIFSPTPSPIADVDHYYTSRCYEVGTKNILFIFKSMHKFRFPSLQAHSTNEPFRLRSHRTK